MSGQLTKSRAAGSLGIVKVKIVSKVFCTHACKILPSKVPVRIGYFALTFARHEKVIAPHEGKIRDHH